MPCARRAAVTLGATGNADHRIRPSRRRAAGDELVELPGSVRELLVAGPDATRRATTLEPDDLIATGSPGGVGFGRTPPVWLTPGQTVLCRIETLGDLKNQVLEEPGART